MRHLRQGRPGRPAQLPQPASQDYDKVYQIAGKYPAVWGSDFGFLDGEDKDSILHRDLMIEEAKKQSAAGSIITLCWHMLRPTEDEPGKADPNGRMSPSWRGSVQAKLTDEQWLELITPDTPLHLRWEKYIDTAAGFLKQLQDAHVPVLWRPMHENNGAFFWWGGRPGPFGTAQLYRELYFHLMTLHEGFANMHEDELFRVGRGSLIPIRVRAGSGTELEKGEYIARSFSETFKDDDLRFESGIWKAGDPGCCPSVTVTGSYTIERNELRVATWRRSAD